MEYQEPITTKIYSSPRKYLIDTIDDIIQTKLFSNPNTTKILDTDSTVYDESQSFATLINTIIFPLHLALKILLMARFHLDLIHCNGNNIPQLI